MTADRAKLLTRSVATALFVVITGLTVTPPALADPDPHIPNGRAGWCPGSPPPPGRAFCLGAAYADGTFYAQGRGIIASQPFRGRQWSGYAQCMTWGNGQLQAAPSGCGGGPASVDPVTGAAI